MFTNEPPPGCLPDPELERFKHRPSPSMQRYYDYREPEDDMQYMNKKTITTGWYWVELTESNRMAVAEVTGEDPGLEVRTPYGMASFSLTEFICRVPTPARIQELERSQLQHA